MILIIVVIIITIIVIVGIIVVFVIIVSVVAIRVIIVISVIIVMSICLGIQQNQRKPPSPKSLNATAWAAGAAGARRLPRGLGV